MCSAMTLQDEFGTIDIYLFDQLLRGRFDRRRRIVDAGCGSGRNLPYFFRHGFDVRAVDADQNAVSATRQLARSLAPGFDPERVQCGALDALPWDSDSADAVI